MKTFIIEGVKIKSVTDFYNTIENTLTKELNWKIGRNLNAFNDILRGGFGAFDFGEPIEIIWEDFGITKENLGKKMTDEILSVIRDHDHISFSVRE